MGSRVIEYYTISGQTYGTVSSVFNDRKTEYEKTGELTFEFSKFGLQSTTIEGQFQARVTDPHKIDIDLSNNDWSIYVNDTLLSNITTTGSALSGELSYLFRDTNNTPITVDTLFISIGFEDNATDIVVTTNGGDVAVNLWNTYLNKNGFKLELKQTEPHFVEDELVKLQSPRVLQIVQTDGTTIELGISPYLSLSSVFFNYKLDLTNAKKIIIPEGVVYIGGFYNSALEPFLVEEIELPKSLKTIARYTFKENTKLTEITIPENAIFYVPNDNSLYGDASHAFRDCTNLKKVTILNNHDVLSKNIFVRCNSLTEIVFNGTYEEWLTICPVSERFMNSYLTDNYEHQDITLHCLDGDHILTN